MKFAATSREWNQTQCFGMNVLKFNGRMILAAFEIAIESGT
jgi:hypothetical protein